MEKYHEDKLIGKGPFGNVLLVTSTSTGKQYALKKIIASAHIIDKYKTELTSLKQVYELSHTNIVKYQSTFINEGGSEYAIVMEYCDSKHK